MSKHDIKGRVLQINQIESLEEEKVSARETLQYTSDRELEELDLIHVAWLERRLLDGGIGLGGIEPQSDDTYFVEPFI